MSLIRGTARDWQTRLRLWAAVMMAGYVITHTINFSLGLISIDAMNSFQHYILMFWRSSPLYWALLAAIVIHVSLGLWKLFRRNTLKMPAWEIFQIVLGASIPFFLLAHISYTRGMRLFFKINDTYTYELLRTFPGGAWQYILLTIIVWGHAQIGVHFVLRMRSFYPRVRILIMVVFFLMPVLGIAGYVTSGFRAMEAARDAGWLEEEKARIHWPAEEQFAAVRTASLSYYGILPILYALVLGSRALRIRLQRGSANITVLYAGGRSVKVASGTTILEASRIGNIPHASICGGRGRCSTCRVRVTDGIDSLKRPGEREQHVLRLVEAAPDVRLACQTECTDDIAVTLLLPPEITAAIARRSGKYAMGRDIKLVVMFADMRGFTSLSEGRLPYDVVFILNRYFSYMGEAIEENGGFIDKFLGDGIMAIFGLDADLKTACRQSIAASRKMADRLVEINEQLGHDLKEPLRIGIGLHAGDVILGEMGYKLATKLTAIGDAVNTASRLEVLNKKANSQLIFSRELAEIGGFDTTGLEERRILLRGKENPLSVFIIKEIKDLRILSS